MITKKKRYYILILALYGLTLQGMQYRKKGQILQVVEDSSKASNRARWNFEIYNKRGKEIYFTLHDLAQRKNVLEENKVASKGKVRTVIDTNHIFQLNIWLTKSPSESVRPDIKKMLLPSGKTVFLTVDQKGIRPQTGIGFGFFGKTDSGLDNTHNITLNDIEEPERVIELR